MAVIPNLRWLWWDHFLCPFNIRSFQGTNVPTLTNALTVPCGISASEVPEGKRLSSIQAKFKGFRPFQNKEFCFPWLTYVYGESVKETPVDSARLLSSFYCSPPSSVLLGRDWFFRYCSVFGIALSMRWLCWVICNSNLANWQIVVYHFLSFYFVLVIVYMKSLGRIHLMCVVYVETLGSFVFLPVPLK